MRSYRLLGLVAVSGLVLDQATKWAVFNYLKTTERIELTPFLSLVLSRNEGGIFGLVTGVNILFVLLSLFAMVILLWVYSHSDKTCLSTNIALGSIFAGAAGNLLDRITYHYVRDFIDLHLETRHWPTFNLADVLICLGVGLMALNTLTPGTLRPR